MTYMKRLFLVLVLLFAGVSVSFAQLNSGDMSRYLAEDAVVVKDGYVVFSNDVKLLEGHTLQQVGNVVGKWLTAYLDKFDKPANRVISSSADKLVAVGDRDLVFTDNAISLDKCRMSYVLTIEWTESVCQIRIERIKYVYDNGKGAEKITAESYITDGNSLNRSRTKLTPVTGKFRKGTIDFKDEVFASFNEALKYYSAAGLADIVKNAPQVMQAHVAAPAAAAPAAPAVQAVQDVLPPVEKAEVVSSREVAGLVGFRKVSPEELQDNFINKISREWMLITAGNKEKFNMMTASWGGVGVLYNRPVAICFINPARYTYRIMESSDTYTLTFYPKEYRKALEYCGTKSGRDEDKVKGSGLTPVEVETGAMAFGEANIIIECRKLVSQSISLDAIDNQEEKSKRATQPMPKMYIGEIVNVWVKD